MGRTKDLQQTETPAVPTGLTPGADTGHDVDDDRGRSGGLLGRTRRMAGSDAASPDAPPESADHDESPAGSARRRRPAITLDEPAPNEPSPTPPPEPRGVPERLAALASQILDARVGLEAPGVLFSLLKRHLGIGKAALLVPDATHTLYTPWAAEGLDRTSLRRLRLDSDQAAKLTPGVATGDGLRPWHKLFSARDAGGMERLYHWPCRADEGVTAVVVAQEMTEDLAEDPVFREHLPEILEAVGHTLADRRERELARGQAAGGPDVTASPERFLEDALANAAQREAVLVRLNLGPLLAAAVQAAPATDRFRLTQDVALTLAYLTREIAEVVIAASPDELYLLFHGAQSPDADLWIHTLLGALGRLLPTLGRLPELETRAIRYPKDGATALALMSSLG